MEIATVKRILALAEQQLTATDYAALHKTVQREYLYDCIEQCDALLNRRVYPVSEKPLMELAAKNKAFYEAKLAAL